jgi:hypothetical protein
MGSGNVLMAVLQLAQHTVGGGRVEALVGRRLASTRNHWHGLICAGGED